MSVVCRFVICSEVQRAVRVLPHRSVVSETIPFSLWYAVSSGSSCFGTVPVPSLPRRAAHRIPPPLCAARQTPFCLPLPHFPGPHLPLLSPSNPTCPVLGAGVAGPPQEALHGAPRAHRVHAHGALASWLGPVLALDTGVTVQGALARDCREQNRVMGRSAPCRASLRSVTAAVSGLWKLG